MIATDRTDSSAQTPIARRGRRLAAAAGAALLAGALVGGSTALVGFATWRFAIDGPQDRPVGTALVELADASSRLAAAIALFASADASDREASRARLDQDAAGLAALLSRLPKDETGPDGAAAMRRLLAGIDTELADLRRLVERREEEERALAGMLHQVHERHAAFRRSLGSFTDDAFRALDAGRSTEMTEALSVRFRLDDLAGELAGRLLDALAASDAAGLAERQSEVRRLAERLYRDLGDLPIGSTAVRQVDSARRLAALGVDSGNVFDLRRGIGELAAAAATTARNARERADAIGALARAERDGGAAGAAPGAPVLLAAALTSGVSAALCVAAAMAAGRRQPLRPAGAAPSAGKDAPETVTQALPPLHILVAEDERLNQMVAAALLRRNGHSVTVVEDGLKAVAAVERERVDLVLMDLRMPGLGGIGALRRIRALPDPARARTPVVVLTASAIPADAAEAQDAGADAVLPKPLRWDTLEPVLHSLFAAGSSRPTIAGPAPVPAAPPDFDEAAVRQMRDMLPPTRVAALIETTLAALTEHHRALNAAWAAGNLANVSALAHRIAGVSGVYGCTGLRAAAQALELAIERGDGDPAPLVGAVDQATGPALAYLRSLLAEAGERDG